MRTAIALSTGVVALALMACKPVDPTVKAPPIVLISEEEGFGRPAEDGDLVTIKYRLTTPDGTEILEDDEYKFFLGTGSVIEGIDDAVLGMRRRGRRVVNCPPHKHWGSAGYGNGAVPADTPLIIDVTLLDLD